VHRGDRVHIVNIVLMAIVLMIAIKLPFELFLFAYAVFGPLHYITEINWLNNNRFYVEDKRQIWILVALTILASLPLLANGIIPYLEGGNFFINPFINYLGRFYGTFILIGFIVATSLVYFKKKYFIILLIFGGMVTIYFFRHTEPYYLLTTLLLPSLIHVYIFTLIFMVYGVTKTRSKIGLLEVLFLVMVPIIIFYLPINLNNYSISSATLANFIESNFKIINIGLGKILGVKSVEASNEVIRSEAGIKIQIFIAFAYLYHYLNWFSKVSLIGWLKNTSIQKMIGIFLFWIASVGLYWYNYRVGLGALFFLSLLHVILEFPLNIVSIQGLFSFIKEKFILVGKNNTN
jgi:hypothetical protein